MWGHLLGTLSLYSLQGVLEGAAPVLPLWFHVDGVSIYNAREFTIWSWSSALAEPHATNVWDIKFPFCVVPEEWVIDQRDWERLNEEITNIIADDFQELLRGGSPRAAFVGVRCDWKARKAIHNFKRNYLCNLICDKCMATKDHVSEIMTYHDVELDAPWRASVQTNEEYVAEAVATGSLSPWMAVPGAHVDLFHFDLMHVLYLGPLSKPARAEREECSLFCFFSNVCVLPTINSRGVLCSASLRNVVSFL